MAIMDEVQAIEWWANASDISIYRGSPNGLVKIQSRDVAHEHYGRDYTEEEKLELAIRNALAKRGHAPEEIDELTEEWLEAYPKAIEELDKELEAERRNREGIPK
jgi:hypothetical protein